MYIYISSNTLMCQKKTFYVRLRFCNGYGYLLPNKHAFFVLSL